MVDTVEDPWHGTVTDVRGDWLTVDLRHEGSPDLVAEVSASRWNLADAQPGDVLVLDTEAGTVTWAIPGSWTQEELAATWRRAAEWADQVMAWVQ